MTLQFAKASLSKARHTLLTRRVATSSGVPIELVTRAPGGPLTQKNGRPACCQAARHSTRSCGGTVELSIPYPREEALPATLRKPEHRPVRVLGVADQHGGRRLGDLHTMPGGAAALALAPGQIVLMHPQPFLRTNSHLLQRMTTRLS